MFLKPASSINYTNKNQYRPAFGAEMNAVRYVVVDGHVVDDKKVVEEVARQLVKTLKQGKEEDIVLRRAAKEIVPTFSMVQGFQEAAFLKLNKMGKEFNIVLGEAAAKMKFIWKRADVSLQTKKQQASELVKQLIYDKTSKHIAIEATTKMVKGKVKYLIKNIYLTI